MQKVLRRAYLADKQATRRAAKRTAKNQKDLINNQRSQTVFNYRLSKKDIVEARKVRRENWELGPLAPKRDVGDKKETYGAMSPQQLRGPELSEEEKRKILAPFGGKYLNLVENDRVVLLEGKDKGKIGRVVKVDESRAEVTVEGLNMVDVAVPKWMADRDEDPSLVRSVPKAIPITSVRLVHALHNPETGLTRDVIVKEMVRRNMWRHRDTREAEWERVIPGLNVVIPWPKKEKPEYEIHQGDTIRTEVEQRTYVPTLLAPPMPSSVINELRNKFSKFRVRHDEEYILTKVAEDEANEAKKQARSMEMPVQEAVRLQKKLKKAKAKAGPSKNKRRKELLVSLGHHIVSKRNLRREAERAEVAQAVATGAILEGAATSTQPQSQPTA